MVSLRQLRSPHLRSAIHRSSPSSPPRPSLSSSPLVLLPKPRSGPSSCLNEDITFQTDISFPLLAPVLLRLLDVMTNLGEAYI
ncbi:hypothetical protein AMELA_G00006760 [Ameiurus melas]|uniref:Uncharacterized protein n=1 Tax=Ameiurus melas TaxID=219545 RepID=A0A7J6BFQ4_AMEME|nr:hypothetical protein AMELA_G00006760 [Ameiurus melas]